MLPEMLLVLPDNAGGSSRLVSIHGSPRRPIRFHSRVTTSRNVHSPAYIHDQNVILGIDDTFDHDAKQLTGDEILELVAHHNPDRVTTGPS